VRRCRHHDVDVGAELLGTNKAQKTKTRTHTSLSKNLEQKGLTKVVKICVKITPEFVSKEQIVVKRGIILLNGDKMVSKYVVRL
jgi:predicted thioredoxin/glutaredoxin